METDVKQLAIAFIRALESRVSFADLAAFYHPDIEQIEFPNLITKTTAVRNLADLKAASERGQTVLQKEEYRIQHAYSFGNTAIIEATWVGTLAVPIGNLTAGGEMIAHFAQFFEFKDGRIIKQRNYDCFEPFN